MIARLCGAVVILGCMFLALGLFGWLLNLRQPPNPRPPAALSFDIMVDSASPDLKTHPCTTDPARSCVTTWVMQ